MEPPHSTLLVHRRTLEAVKRLIFPSIFKEPFSFFGSFWYRFAFSGVLSNRFYCCLANRLQSQEIRRPFCVFYALVRQVISDSKVWKNTCNVKVKRKILPWGYNLTWSLGIMGASTFILIVVSPINLALNVFMVHFTPLGLFGSPLAISISYWLCFTGLGVWTYLSPTHKSKGTWGGIQIRAVLNPMSCFQFLKLALPGILMVGTEWYDITFLLRSSTPLIR